MSVAKKVAGYAATEHIVSGMTIGLGTGSTAQFFIEKLGEICENGFKIKGVATSIATQKIAESVGIPLVDIDSVTSIDLTVDGADEVDPEGRLLKGGGGALLREKMVAMMSERLIIVVDENKLVTNLGEFPLPIEIVPFAYKTTLKRIEKAGFNGKLRKKKEAPFVTDGGNYIVDLYLEETIVNPEEIHNQIKLIPGVIETGLFFNMATNVLIGFPDGTIEYL